MNISPTIVDILPKDPLIPVLNPWVPKQNNLYDLLNNILKIKGIYIQWKSNISTYNSVGVQRDNPYGKYLQFPNSNIKSLAQSIVSPTDTNDIKVEKIQKWVIENIKYTSDIKEYGTPEYWALPTQTANRREGDCEDGAFLIHSLALNAGVPADRLRTYGGIVEDGITAPTGGHGWTAYKRSSDNQWVTIDWCYYPNTSPLSERPTMKSDDRYIDDYFWVDVTQTYDASLTNDMKISFYV